MRRLVRWTLNALTVLSLMLCVIGIALWATGARWVFSWGDARTARCHISFAGSIGFQRQTGMAAIVLGSDGVVERIRIEPGGFDRYGIHFHRSILVHEDYNHQRLPGTFGNITDVWTDPQWPILLTGILAVPGTIRLGRLIRSRMRVA